ncbi:hypothetical protein [Nitrospirillum viridazoti]|uniref:Uncharacterized protein n=1 Tax=Nitrospirillum viridazoti CBAmc TaxID=1441467 RepID=A0A248JRT8_9PROT|nr:hypothetical protein [Nitrospirillum amazonense]ASG20798.1 hypothetical protein Y958_08225 [Nitrospirillum amazonense CBAmc]TWB37871.1 hypothetical protein FBZ91_107184 [Nitrospirillum amazonense]
MDGWQRRYRLSNGPGGLGVSCTAEGLALAGVPLLAKGAGGFQARPVAEVSVLLKRAYAGIGPHAAVLPSLVKIADALNRGDLVQAMIRAVHLRLPELDWDAAVRLARANDNLAKYSPDQPRDWHGRWADGEGGEREAGGPVEAKPAASSGREAATKPKKRDADIPKAQALPPVSTASDFAIPANPYHAPPVFRFADDIEQANNSLWQESLAPLSQPNAPRCLETGEKVREHGATVVARQDGALEFQNKDGKGVTCRDFRPDLQVKDPTHYSLLGTTHTHPYDDGRVGVSFSGGDTQVLLDNPINFSLVQSGDKQFMFLKTKQTRRSDSYENVIKYQDDRVKYLMDELGYPSDTANRIANVEAAKNYGLAYYEGDHGVLRRIYPEVR